MTRNKTHLKRERPIVLNDDFATHPATWQQNVGSALLVVDHIAHTARAEVAAE